MKIDGAAREDFDISGSLGEEEFRWGSNENHFRVGLTLLNSKLAINPRFEARGRRVS